MKKVTAASAALITLLVFSAIPMVAAAATEVNTNKASYFVGEQVTITGTADPNELVGLQVTNPVGTIILLVGVQADTSGIFTRTFRLPVDAASGTYTASANGAVTTFTVTRDTTPPVIGTVAFDKPSYLPADTVTMSVMVSDAAAVASVFSDVAPMTLTSGNQQSGTWSATIKAPGTPGTYPVTVTAQDFSGNIATKSGSYRVVGLGGQQLVEVQVEASGTYMPGDTARIWVLTTFNGSLVDATFRTSHIFVPGATGPTALGAFTKVHTGWFYTDYAVASGAPDGLYAIHIVAVAEETANSGMGSFQVNSKIASDSDINSAVGTIGSNINTASGNINAAIMTAVDGQTATLKDAISASETSVKRDISAVSSKLDSVQSAVIGAVNSASDGVKQSVAGAQSALTQSINEVKATVAGLSTTLESINAGVAQVSTYVLIIGALAAIILVVEIVIIVRRR